jgi:hypothetical protein
LGKLQSRAPVSRVLSGAGRVAWPVDGYSSDGCLLPDISSDLPGHLWQDRQHPPRRIMPLYGLASDGVYLAGACRQSRGALLPHLFTLTAPERGGLFSVALSLGSPPLAVNQHPDPVKPGLSSAGEWQASPPAATIQPSGLPPHCARAGRSRSSQPVTLQPFSSASRFSSSASQASSFSARACLSFSSWSAIACQACGSSA